jgi:hypothetical protein
MNRNEHLLVAGVRSAPTFARWKGYQMRIGDPITQEWQQNQWALEAAAYLAVMEEGWKRNIGKYSDEAYVRYSAYHHAYLHFERELAYWRERVSEDVKPWFDGSAFR